MQGEYRRFILTFNPGSVFCFLRFAPAPSFLPEENLSEEQKGVSSVTKAALLASVADACAEPCPGLDYSVSRLRLVSGSHSVLMSNRWLPSILSGEMVRIEDRTCFQSDSLSSILRMLAFSFSSSRSVYGLHAR